MMMVQDAIDHCVRCGFCLPACPTYQLTHDEESSPRGRIALAHAVIERTIQPDLQTLSTFNECLGCRACESACPSGVVYERVFLFGREELVKAGNRLPLHVRGLLLSLRSPLFLRLARRVWRRWGVTVLRLGSKLPAGTPMLAMLHSTPAPGDQTVEDSPRAAVAIHRGCIMDILWEQTNARAVSLLQQSGVPAMRLSPSAGCCGALHAHSGDRETARKLARTVIDRFERSGAQTIVSLAGGCGAHLQHYADLFDPGEPWHPRAQRFSRAVRDIATLLAENDLPLRAGTERTTYQDSCHLRHGLSVWREPRAMLRASSDYEELPSAARCCGSAGIYNLLQPDIAGELLRSKTDEARRMSPEVIVTSNPGCELQWRMGVKEAGLTARVCHLVDYLYEHRSQA